MSTAINKHREQQRLRAVHQRPTVPEDIPAGIKLPVDTREYKRFELIQKDYDGSLFWTINTTIPVLQGQFTSLYMAQSTIDNYSRKQQ